MANVEVEVVAWGNMGGDACCICDTNLASIYVAEVGDLEMHPACNECVPPGTTRDRIGEVFAKALKA